MSEVRQVPNHQEFYADVDKGTNIVTEINEYQSRVSDEKINDFFFENLAKDTSAKSTSVLKKGQANMPGAKDYYTSYIIGDHVVNERIDNRGPELRVRVHMACIRLKSVTSDMVLIFSVPLKKQLSNEENEALAQTFFQILEAFTVKSLAVFKGS
eukprot:CAMPEP_0167779492 /NCGR_PEP_ID=MMETSP0111_2-20121227/4833_1 /TAXON_ID=91324 /ORGANISM="Lotharella globosa, Strain CCCM811" /LENGTH=154 /DNA_ID=CAMNT_0007669901 /DNA_START=39 /DNA_END=503 /DNA_ORIENTATION=-